MDKNNDQKISKDEFTHFFLHQDNFLKIMNNSKDGHIDPMMGFKLMAMKNISYY